ncbi:amidohydrolase [Ktedonosporobacter rubrisoli]|uniref:Amidohydrolase n=1 Tax=Ktedonosporobacter rubrisoli TaxID=2509675 RepID=A0A4P6JYW4_KTERU|nr:amidohydrolase family protein [Ktedonosporobacter rubrisoli]QBD80765.1 amidohydrolase [Ktedonosporobacter rubrisoli]
MKIIALEEHFQTAAIKEAVEKQYSGQQAKFPLKLADPLSRQLGDIGEERLQNMDKTGIDVQFLSHTTPGPETLPAAEAVPLARDANDQLAAAIKAHPERFAGFATLPTPDPEASAQELERTVRLLGFKGAMINGRTGTRFLDDPAYRQLLETAAKLDVPLYIHPTVPSQAVQDAYYAGFDPVTNFALATGGWGWHMETGIHALRMIVAGVFDRFPGLQIILGHWGEMIPFYLARATMVMETTPAGKSLQRPFADYFTQNFYATPSGLFTVPQFLLTLQIMGADRIMYSVDYPYRSGEQARRFLEEAPISPADKEKIAHLNAEKLLKL